MAIYNYSCSSLTLPANVQFQSQYSAPPDQNSQLVKLLACVAWRFWLGAQSNKGGRGQRNREEIGAGATWRAKFHITIKPLTGWGNWNQTICHQGVKIRWRWRQLKIPRIRAGGFYFSRGFAARASLLDKTAKLRRLQNYQKTRAVTFAELTNLKE